MPRARLRHMIATRTADEPEKGQERQISVQAGDFFGLDVRPSRVFLWTGRERDHNVRIASLERRPRVLRYPRQRRFVHVGGGEVSYLGNPALTVGLAAWGWFRHLRRAKGSV